MHANHAQWMDNLFHASIRTCFLDRIYTACTRGIGTKNCVGTSPNTFDLSTMQLLE